VLKYVSYNERFDGADEQTVASAFFEHCSSYGVPFHLLYGVQLLPQVVDGSVQLTLHLTATCPPQHTDSSQNLEAKALDSRRLESRCFILHVTTCYKHFCKCFILHTDSSQNLVPLPEMESSRSRPWTRGASRTTRHVLGLGLERRVFGFGLGGQVHGLRSKALDLDPFSLVCLVFMLIRLVL